MSELTETHYSITGSAGDVRVSTGKRIGTLLALFVTGVATFINLYASQPLLPLFREIFDATELMVSLTVTAPVLAVAVAAPFVGLLADTLGRKRVIVAAMLCLTLPTTLAATAGSLNQLIVWRFLQGIFIPGIVTVVMAYISEESPHRAAGSTMATYISGTVVGGFSGRFIAGLCAAHSSWRVAFVVLGVATFLGCLITVIFLPRSTRFVRQKGAAASLDSLGQHLKNPQLLATYAIGFNVLFCLVGAFTYINFYLADRPFSLGPAALGTVFTVYLIGAVITPGAGVILDRVGHRRTLMIAAGIIVGGMLMTLIQRLPVIIAGLTLASTGVFACQAAASSYVGKAAGKARSSAAGLYVGFYYLGGCAGSLLPGFFWRQSGWPGCVALILCVQVVLLLIAKTSWKG